MSRRVDLTPAGNPVNHGGSGSSYTNYGCRCDECTEANRRRLARRQRQRRIELLTGYNEHEPEHGKYATYSNWGCRCQPCTVAWSKSCADYRARRRTP